MRALAMVPELDLDEQRRIYRARLLHDIDRLEKLDGSGYRWGLRAKQLDQASRILTVVDIYNADRQTSLCEQVVDAAYSLGTALEQRNRNTWHLATPNLASRD